MCQLFNIEQLADSFALHPKKAELYIKQIKEDLDLVPKQQDNQFSLSTKAQQYFEEVKNYNQEHQYLLNYTLCKKINNLPSQKDKNLILQLTKRTKLKQQKEQQKFEQLPKLIKLEKELFAEKVLNWLENKVVFSDLNKIIVDRFTNENDGSEKKPDLRITVYENNHPQDINLIIKEKLNYLKQIDYEEIESKLDSQVTSLTELKEELTAVNDEKLIKRIFKTLVGYKDYYKLTTNPEMIIIDFSQIKLPSELKVSEEEDCLLLQFDNNCQITICNQGNQQLVTKLKKEPQAMELFSL